MGPYFERYLWKLNFHWKWDSEHCQTDVQGFFNILDRSIWLWEYIGKTAMDFWCIDFVVFGNGCTSKGVIAVVNCLEVLWNAS